MTSSEGYHKSSIFLFHRARSSASRLNSPYPVDPRQFFHTFEVFLPRLPLSSSHPSSSLSTSVTLSFYFAFYDVDCGQLDPLSIRPVKLNFLLFSVGYSRIAGCNCFFKDFITSNQPQPSRTYYFPFQTVLKQSHDIPSKFPDQKLKR